MTVTSMALSVSHLTPHIGTRIDSDGETLLSGRHAQEIRALLETRSVLVFPEIGFDDEQQIAFTRSLGALAYDYNGVPMVNGEQQAIFKVSLDEKVSPTARSLKNSLLWHLDGTTHDVPILASVLTARHLAPAGGETEWCSTYAAYEALPDEDKRALEGLRAVHSNLQLQRNINPELSYADFRRARGGPSKSQPLVWTHRNGRKSLVVGATAAYVEGMPHDDSLELLVRLRDWATQPQFVYRHEWKIGDMVIWDNTGTLHRALPYAPDSGRLMHRSMLAGEEPFA
ncbi:TauD/TfdA family dioxygenase [Novosphingobium sp. CF614]|uniref:TauD/TfdA dioxygenase family protein n=1 Tax=Novosphingobium sp. CF614 TaxID=1884364 RepID=UPI000B846113|nr:TauD/TfdA family dioxygenase [Novosphingobium sp. CF614]